MPQRDYYAILGVQAAASPEDIKKAYRKLALETHPDRNPGDSLAEDRFKLISEAYAVLGEPSKRSDYDRYRTMGFGSAGAGQAHSGRYRSQEDIFRDAFANRSPDDLFAELQKEFERMGFRFDATFVDRIFFGGRGGQAQGFFWSSQMGGMRRPGPGGPGFRRQAPVRPMVPLGPGALLKEGISLIGKAVKKAGQFIFNQVDSGAGASRIAGQQSDVVYRLVITPRDAISGAVVQVDLPHLNTSRRVSVRIPAGVKTGTRLRLKDMGKPGSGIPNSRGDLYIELQVA